MPFFNKSTPYAQSDVSLNNSPIQVIASFSCTGEILPLYAKLRSHTLKLSHAIRVEQNPFADKCSMRFRCQCILTDLDPEYASEETVYKEIHLLYYIDRHCWVMEREK